MLIYSQRDNKWKDKKLGFSDLTLGGYGCLVTCLAMIARHFGKDTNPGKMNNDLKEKGRFQGGYYKWKGVEQVYPDIIEHDIVFTPQPLTDSQLKEIDNHLEEGRLVMFEVDYNPNTACVEGHFVLALSKSDKTYRIADPWTGRECSLKKYGEAKYTIQRYILYGGPVVPSDENDCDFLEGDVPTEVEEEFKLKEQGWYNKRWTGREFIWGVSEEIIRTKGEIRNLERKIRNLEVRLASKEPEYKKEAQALAKEKKVLEEQLEVAVGGAKTLEERWKEEKNDLFRQLVDQDAAIEGYIIERCGVSRDFILKWETASGLSWIFEGIRRLLKRG